MKSLVSRLSHLRVSRLASRALVCSSAPRVSRLASLALALSLVSCAVGATNELDVARQALRDGFWTVARQHALAASGAEAERIVLESHAREGRWPDVLQALGVREGSTGDIFRCYRALALAKTGDAKGAKAVFAEGLPADAACRRMSVRLLAGLALDEGEAEKAASLLKGLDPLEADDRLLLAEAESRLGAGGRAEVQWRAVLADTNATLRAVATAAANLGDAARLRNVISNRPPADIRAFATLRLGRILLSAPETFDEGAKIIRGAMTSAPDEPGTLEAARALASAHLVRKEWTAAAAAYAELLEIWPAAARDVSVREGQGVSHLRLGHGEEALASFRQAESVAADDEDRARVAVRVADALAALGRVDESTAKCREALSNWPKCSIAAQLKETVRLRELESKGRVFYREFRFAEAQKAFAEVGAGDALRRDRMAFFELLCLYGQGRDAEAEASARKLVAQTGDEVLRADVRQWLARAAYNGGRWHEAVELFSACAASSRATAQASAESYVWAARAALAENGFNEAIALAAKVAARADESPAKADALIVQGEALLELARFDEAVLVLDRAAAIAGVPTGVRTEAQRLRADALFAMGADNPARYEQALAAYRTLLKAESLAAGERLSLSYKIGITLEKLRRLDEAADQYYSQVILAYRAARLKGERFSDEPRAVFARAAFRLADLCEARGDALQATRVLELVSASDVPAAAEARTRIDRIRKKGIMP